MKITLSLIILSSITLNTWANSAIDELETGCYYSLIRYELPVGRGDSVQVTDQIYLNVIGDGKWKRAFCDEFVPYPNYCWRQNFAKNGFELMRVASSVTKKSFSLYRPLSGYASFRKIREGQCSR